jgi:hypothetical protein
VRMVIVWGKELSSFTVDRPSYACVTFRIRPSGGCLELLDCGCDPFITGLLS